MDKLSKSDQKSQFLKYFKDAFHHNTFVKLTLSANIGEDKNLKNVYIKMVLIKNNRKLSYTYRYKTKDIVKNYDFEEALELLESLIDNQFKNCSLFTITNDFVFEKRSSKRAILRTMPASEKSLPSLSHDNNKNRKIDQTQDKLYLHLLGLTDEKGKVYPKSQDKFKQINHYIEVLSPALKSFDKNKEIKIVDMGSGKGYLTFALYDYLVNQLKFEVEISGVENRQELVDLCNSISQKCNFKSLKFLQGSIENYSSNNIDIVIALHACDTATDDAIAKGVKSDSKLIVTAPCCQHQIRKEIEKSSSENILSPITKHGIFLERQAELITDGIRTMILEYFGYKTKAIEFITDSHTHKNVMIIAQKSDKMQVKKEVLTQINAIKTQFGITTHYLEKLLL
jgi:hypothetical protein